MSLIYSLFLFAIGTVLYYYKKGAYFLHYFLCWIAIAPIVYNFMFDMDKDEYWLIMAWSSKLGDFALLNMFITRKTPCNQFFKYILSCLIIAVMYVVLLIVMRGLPFIQYLKYGLESFSIIAGMSMFVTRCVNVFSLYKFLKFFFYAELILGFTQIFVQSINFPCAFSSFELLYVNGTFLGNNTYVEFLTCLFILICYIEYRKAGRFTLIILITSVFHVFLVFESGVRMALVALLIPYGYFVYLYIKSHNNNRTIIKYAFVGLLIIIGLLKVGSNYLSNNSLSYTKDAISASDRQAVLASVFLDNSYLIEHTTFALSYKILLSLSSNPITGPGSYFKGNGYDGYSFKDGSSITDATLALFMGEFGLLGVVLLFIMLYYLLNKINHNKKGAIVIASYLLFVSITDNGIFGSINLFILISMIILENYYVLNNKCSTTKNIK